MLIGVVVSIQTNCNDVSVQLVYISVLIASRLA